MFNRIKILTLLQLGNSIKISPTTDKKKIFLYVFLRACLVVALTAAIFGLLTLIKNVLFLPVNMGMLTFFLFVTQVISIIANTNSLMHSLYTSKDNAILLSYPAKPDEVFFSKLIVEYLREIKKNLYFLFPLLIAFGIITGGNVLYFLFSILFFFIIPIFPVFIGALLSIPLALIKKYLDKVPFVYLILLIGVMVLVFIGLESFVDSIPKPLRIIAIYNKFVNGVTQFIVSANKYALFYTFISNILYSINTLLNLLYIVLIAGGLIALVLFISRPIYFSLVSFQTEHSVKKPKKAENSNKKPTFLAFLRKELLLTFRNINQVVTNYLLVILAPVILFAMNVVMSAVITSTLGDGIIVAFNIIVGGILILSSNTQSASAITMEGGEIVLLKTAPSNTANMVWAKMFVNIVLSTLLIIISAIILLISNVMSSTMILGVFIVLILLNWAHILWSFQLDIVNPKLRDYAETGRLENSNTSFSMTLALIISIVMGVIALLLFIDNINIAWTKIIAIAISFFVLRFYFLIINLKAYFKRIEY